MARSRLILQTDSGIDLLTGPHQTVFDELGSSTIRLSAFSPGSDAVQPSGDLPVFLPEKAAKAPVEVIAEPRS